MPHFANPTVLVGQVTHSSTEIPTSEVSVVSPTTAPIDPVLLHALAQYGSPIVVLVLLIWLFKALTDFVKACRGIN